MRQCIFCEAPAATREDAWPRWLARRARTPHGVEVEAERRGVPLPQWRTSRHEIRVRSVCGRCNNGWMSDMETRAKPVLEGLLDRSTLKLGPREQSTIAEWATKCAMVFEALRGSEEWFYTTEDRRSFRTGSTMPNRTHVWVAKCVDLPGLYCSSTDHFDSMDSTSASARVYVTTMAFESLALQVATLRMPPAIPASVPITTDLVPGPWQECTRRIWPMESEEADWPPPIGLSGEAGVSAFHARWRAHDPKTP